MGAQSYLLSLFHGVFAMAMADALFRQKLITIGERNFTAGRRIARVPVQHE